MVEEIEQFTAESQFFLISSAECLEGGGVPVNVSRTLDNVAAFVPENLKAS